MVEECQDGSCRAILDTGTSLHGSSGQGLGPSLFLTHFDIEQTWMGGKRRTGHCRLYCRLFGMF